MAREITVRFEHAVYDTFTHQRGAALTVDSAALSDLLIAADNALDREEGYFFDTLDGQFVFGFERKREDKHGQSRGMAYFDLFVTPATELSGVKLSAVKRSLESELVPNFESEPDAQTAFRYTVEADERERGGSNPNTDGGDETPSNPPSERVDPAFLAETWERYRRSSAQIRLPFRELDTVVDAVDGLLPEISFVARRSGGEIRSDYFDVVDGTQDRIAVGEELVRTVEDLQRRGELAYDNLPTYEDVLHRERERKKTDVRDGELEERIDRLFDSARDRLQSRVDGFPAGAPELIDAGLRGEVPAETPAEDEPDDGRSLAYPVGVALLIVGFSLLAAVFAGELASAVGVPATAAGAVIGGLGAVPVAAVTLRYENGAERGRVRTVVDVGLAVTVAVAVGLAVAVGASVAGAGDVGVGLGPVDADPVGFAGAFVGLLAGYAAVAFPSRRGVTEEGTGEAETELLDDPRVDGVDPELVAAIDERIRDETESVDEWIDDRLVDALAEELHRATEKHAEETAERTVESIRELKESTAYREADLSDDD